VLELAALFAIVFALGAIPNLIPATAVVTAFSLRDGVEPVAAVLVGATAIACGRLALALAVRGGFDRFVRQGATADNVAWLHGWLEGRRRTHLVLSLALAAPGSPTTTIFVAAGALKLRLAPLVAGFFSGRLVWYGAIVALASGAERSVDRLVERGTSPWLFGVALVLVVVPLLVLSRLEWRALLQERRIRFVPRRRPGTGTGGTGE
jgi:uncharacterized membrane protein YdjX (TVP38/TMEM64 family)